MALARMLMGGPAETQGTAFEPVTRQQQLANYRGLEGAENAWRTAEGSPWKPAEQPGWAKAIGRALASEPGQRAMMLSNFMGPGPRMPGPVFSPRDAVRLFHGTTQEGHAQITGGGSILGPAFFTPRREMAESYGPHVVEAHVPKDRLMIDFDLPGAKLLSLEEANRYAGTPGRTIDDWLQSGQSVGVPNDVPIKR